MPAKNSPKPPTQREQIAELREQVATMITAMQGLTGPAVPSRSEPVQTTEPLPTVHSPLPPVAEPRSHGDPVLRFLWGVVLIGVPLALMAVAAWHEFGPTAEKLPAHKAIVVYSQLIASDVLGEIEAQIERCEETGDPFTAEQLKAILLERGEEARSAAWAPVLESINDLQGEDGSIAYTKARAMVSKTRKGLEAVR